MYIEPSIPKTQKTLFSNVHETFSKIDHMLEHKTNLNKYKKIEIISSLFSDHIGLEVENNHKEKIQKHSNSWRLNSMLLNNEWGNNESKEEVKTFLEISENEHKTTKVGDTTKAVLKGKFIVIQCYLKMIETFQINNLTLYQQELEEQQQTKSEASRRKKLTKIRG